MSSALEPPRRAKRRRRVHRLLPAPATPAGGDSNVGVGTLPLDALSEILLHLPGKQLCRLRAVCRAWRCLLTAPWFAAAHAARRPEPYVVLSYAGHADLDCDGLVDVLDMWSGQIVRHVAAEDASDVVVSVAVVASGLVCIVLKTIESGSFRLLNPITGAVHRLSGELAPEHAARGFSLRDYREPVHMLGQFAGTGELKVLRMLRYKRQHGAPHRDDLFEVCTLNSSNGGARWRGKHGPPRPFLWKESTRVVVGGVVYFVSMAAYFTVMYRRADEQDWIVRFDLEAEEWRPSIKGPSGWFDAGQRNLGIWTQVTLANLNGSLVIVLGSRRIMDLWFLNDCEEGGIWVKKYSVEIGRSGRLSPMHPLLVLEDGRIVTVIRSGGSLLLIYDPRTSTFARLMMLRHSSRVSLHTGSFLSLHGR